MQCTCLRTTTRMHQRVRCVQQVRPHGLYGCCQCSGAFISGRATCAYASAVHAVTDERARGGQDDSLAIMRVSTTNRPTLWLEVLR
jgi:hypothetical protein